MCNLSALTISKCLTTAIHLLLFSLLKDIRGQVVQLDPKGIERVSTCSSGLRHGIDLYTVRGIVDATTNKLSNFINFQIQTTSTNDFQLACTVSLVSCITPNPQPCYCAVQKGNIYEIVANRSAISSTSNAQIRIQWFGIETIVLSNTLQLPTIYDLDSVTTSLTLNDAPMTCPPAISHGSVIKFQCQNSPSPCDLTIVVNKDVVKGEHNATYTVTYDPTSYSTYNFTFSYSICGGPVKSTTCLVDIVTKTTPELVTSTTKIPANLSDSSLKFESWGIVLIIIFYIGILVTVVTVIAILYLIIIAKTLQPVFKLFVVFLVFAEVLCVILIIVFALAKSSSNDPEPGSNILAQWKIMLIIYCAFQGALFLAAVVVAIMYFKKCCFGSACHFYGVPAA